MLFSFLVLLSFSGIFFAKEIFHESRSVHIEVDGRPVYILPLDKNRVVSVQGPQGNTLVEIKDHKVRVVESPCPNKLCVKQGWISSGAIVCLPNRVVVTVGDFKTPEHTIDATTG